MPIETPQNNLERQLEIRREIIALAREIVSRHEVFPFAGLEPLSYQRMMATDAEYPGFTTPTDQIIARCQREGIKVIFGRDPESGNVYILPAGSDDIEGDSFSPKDLKTFPGISQALNRLIVLDRARQ